jgi:hypothetical protein
MKNITAFIRTHSTKFIVGLVSLGVIVLIIALWPRHKEVVPVAEISAPLAEITAKPKPVYYKPAPKPVAAKLAYVEALKQYASSRVQLDEICHATPSPMVLKGGTNLMVDNRSSQTRAIMFGNITTTVGAYDYLILPTKTVTSSEKVLLDCGTKQNVTEVTLEP